MRAAPLLMTRDYMQQAWVVQSLAVAMRHWTEVCGVGPFFVMEHVPMENLTYRGKPAKLDCSIAIAQAGRTQVELIEQHCDNPSIYRDLVPKGHSAFHHVAVICEDYDRDLAHCQSLGYAEGATGSFGDMRFAYIDTSRDLDCVIELLEDKASIRDHFKMIADAAVDWDGRDPVRPAY
jgi:Glyoxalase/Bleomycin resistance protein/Dioxygenase superfamily